MILHHTIASRDSFHHFIFERKKNHIARCMKFGRLSVIAVFLLIVFSSCNKNSFLGLDIIPSTDEVGAVFTDTFSLVTNTIRDDSVLSSSTINNITGTLYDPVFGKTYAAFFTEFLQPTNDVDFGSPDTLFIDSLVFTLAYNGFYGYNNVPQTINVFRVTEAMNPLPSGGYYSNKSFAVDPEPIGRKLNFVPDFVDSINVSGVLSPPHLRIRLSDRLGQELLNQSGTANLTNDSAFKNYFKGICIAPDTIATPYGASILYFSLTSPVSGLRLYWHSPNVAAVAYDFPITTSEVRLNYFKHNYSGTIIPQHLQNSAQQSDSVIFVQGTAGLKTRISIPALPALSNVLVNKAELVITQELDPLKTDSIFTAPSQIVCVTQDTSGKDVTIPDNFNLFPFFGGARITKVTLDRHTYVEYHFSIADQVQQIIDGKITDRGLFLIPYRRGETADRLMAGGALRVDNLRMKLNLIYTPIH